MQCCRKEGIQTVGSGENITEAKKPLIVEAAGFKIGIMAFAEHEFNVASEYQAGANVLDVYYSFDDINDLRAKCDYLIVLYHGGIEHYEYPSPILQKKCRKMVESGANVVLCQHSHCVGTAETYKGGEILYGQGNTVFGYRHGDPNWNSGLIVKVLLSKAPEVKASVQYIPVSAGVSGIDVMSGEKAAAFMDDFSKRSQKINDKNFITNSWRRFCKKNKNHYLPLLLGLGRILNYLNRKTKGCVVNSYYSKKLRRISLNLIRCEAHNEVIQTILDDCTHEGK